MPQAMLFNIKAYGTMRTGLTDAEAEICVAHL
jgi:hypothetical protein